MDKKNLSMVLSDISDELFTIERDIRTADALQEDVLENIFQNDYGSLLSDGKKAVFTLAMDVHRKSYFAEAVNTYVKKLVADISILRQQVETLMKEGVTA